jgi:hypothetical protein
MPVRIPIVEYLRRQSLINQGSRPPLSFLPGEGSDRVGDPRQVLPSVRHCCQLDGFFLSVSDVLLLFTHSSLSEQELMRSKGSNVPLVPTV